MGRNANGTRRGVTVLGSTGSVGCNTVELLAADPDAYLAAGLLLATWTIAFTWAHRTFRETRNTKEANAAFLAVIDKGTAGLKAAMAGTPYA